VVSHEAVIVLPLTALTFAAAMDIERLIVQLRCYTHGSPVDVTSNVLEILKCVCNPANTRDKFDDLLTGIE